MSCYIKEYDLIREVLFSLQGLNGQIIRQDTDGRFTITKSHIKDIDPPQLMLIEKLTNFGWLVNRIKLYINSVKENKEAGKVTKSLAAALNNELLEYYRLVTFMEHQLQKCANQDSGQTRASTPTSDIYGVGGIDIRSQPQSIRPSATYESLQTAITGPTNGYNNGNLNMNMNIINNHHNPQYPQQANSDDGFGTSPTTPLVTLHQIHLWSLDYYFRLKTLVMLVECCKNKRGGQLAQIVYKLMQHGDKQIKAIMSRILSQVVLPIRYMLSQWIFHGEIQDPFNEFFICLEDSIVPEPSMASSTMMSLSHSVPLNVNQNQNLSIIQPTYETNSMTFNSNNTTLYENRLLCNSLNHHNRNHLLPASSSMSSLSSGSVEEKQYIINDDMMPGFISMQQANKILATGKAVHLLKKVCDGPVNKSVPGYDDLKKSFESTNIEALFKSRGLLNYGEENEFEHLLNTAYKEVSQMALKLLFGNYKLRSHFRGLRQYLLLGQGDFIRHLMDLLKKELDKPALMCRFPNIRAVMDNAMDSTNAQFEEPDVKNRLDCKLLNAPSPDATGWDIFTLVYKVDGPISTIFTEEKIRDYVDIFRQLWRTKRVEHVLTSLWSEQMIRSKEAIISMPLFSPVLHRANILLSDMIYFMQHYQNYIMFEVVECSWVELVAATDIAKDVDDIIVAHDNYLRKIKKGTLCQEDILFECIFEFEQLMKSLWKDVEGDLRLLPESETIGFLKSFLVKIQNLAIKFQKNHHFKRESSTQKESQK